MVTLPGRGQPPVGAVADHIRQDGVVPLIGSDDPDRLQRVAEAVAEAGLSTLEVTLRSPGAMEAFTQLVDRVEAAGLPIMIGVGTVLDASTAAVAIERGAQFVFSPMLSPDVLSACHTRRVPYFPGCATPTEIHRALTLGCELVKLFPADAIGGPDFLRSVKAVFPELLAVPTGGIMPDPSLLRPWFDAGAAAVGIGSSLFDEQVLTEAGSGALRSRVVSVIEAVAAAREENAA